MAGKRGKRTPCAETPSPSKSTPSPTPRSGKRKRSRTPAKIELRELRAEVESLRAQLPLANPSAGLRAERTPPPRPAISDPVGADRTRGSRTGISDPGAEQALPLDLGDAAAATPREAATSGMGTGISGRPHDEAHLGYGDHSAPEEDTLFRVRFVPPVPDLERQYLDPDQWSRMSAELRSVAAAHLNSHYTRLLAPGAKTSAAREARIRLRDLFLVLHAVGSARTLQEADAAFIAIARSQIVRLQALLRGAEGSWHAASVLEDSYFGKTKYPSFLAEHEEEADKAAKKRFSQAHAPSPRPAPKTSSAPKASQGAFRGRRQ